MDSGTSSPCRLNPGKTSGGALLGACRLHDDMELAERAARLSTCSSSTQGTLGRYAALAQMYDDNAGRWDDASRVRLINATS